jgi:hypothetical protein
MLRLLIWIGLGTADVTITQSPDTVQISYKYSCLPKGLDPTVAGSGTVTLPWTMTEAEVLAQIVNDAKAQAIASAGVTFAVDDFARVLNTLSIWTR